MAKESMRDVKRHAKRSLERSFPRPRVVISRCLSFEACRYNGLKIEDDFVSRLVPHIEVITVCPEVEIGLGVPRDPIRLVRDGKTMHLKQPKTGRDVSAAMTQFAGHFLRSLKSIDGFILKSRSPTCGIKDVKVYAHMNAPAADDRTAGLFGAAVGEHFHNAAVEDEGRLRNYRIREHFLTKLFTLAQFRSVRSEASMKALVEFHSRNKFMLMAYHQEEMRRLGRLVANAEHQTVDVIGAAYEAGLGRVFSKIARFTSHINVLTHGLGYFSDRLSPGEKQHFLGVLEAYRAGRVPLSQAIGIIQSWVIRFDERYLAQQTYFQPYPMELVEITDSGKGRGV